jgi:MFS family permease
MILRRHNVIVLAASQALMQTAVVMSVAVGSVMGRVLAENERLATLPIALLIIGTAVASLPAGLAMRRWGRKVVFMLGTLIGMMGSLIAAAGLSQGSFLLFVAGHFLLGAYQGIANYYRFAAVESEGSTPSGHAISWVVAGGLVAAFLGPALGQWGRDWIPAELFVGSYVAQAVLSAVAFILLTRLAPCAIRNLEASGKARSLKDLLQQPALQATIFCTAAGYSVMVMVMTATPLAMLGCGLPETSVTPVIQWHVVGMFAPSFFAGPLIARFGAPRIMQLGFALLVGHVLIAVLGIEFLHFLSALILLGVGWNFVFVAGTALLTQTCRPAEQAKVQTANEFAVFGLVAISTLSAGWLHEQFGWAGLNLALLPLLLMAAIAMHRFVKLPAEK